MADYLKLKDDTIFKINNGASLDNIEHIALSEDEGNYISSKVNPENISHVEFYSNLSDSDEYMEKDPSGIYENLTITNCSFDISEMIVHIGLKEPLIKE